MIRDSFDIRTDVKEEMKKGLILGLKARLPIAVIFTYVGYRHEVVPLLQVLSHQTRAYIWNADGLKGFVEVFLWNKNCLEKRFINASQIMPILRLAEKQGRFDKVTQHQEVSLDDVEKVLSKF